MLGINVTYTMKPGARAAFLEGLAACGVREEVLREDGCLQYDYFLPVEGEDSVLLLEKWTSREAQKVHLTQPHMAKFAALKEQFVADTQVVLYDL